MSGVKVDIDDKAEWSSRNESAFIRIVHEWVLRGELQTTTFKPAAWNKIAAELHDTTRKSYSVKQLKAKFNRLRKKHREFSDLISQTGFGWDPNSNTVTAADDVWAEYVKKVPGAKQFRRKGLEHYDILGAIFNTTTATGQMRFSSTQIPPDSDEERVLEDTHMNTGVHVDVDDDPDVMFRPEGNEGTSRRRRRVGMSASEHRPKRWEGMENYMKASCDAMNRRLVLAEEKSANSSIIRETKAELARAKGKIEDLTRKLEKSAQMTRDRDTTAESIHKAEHSATKQECMQILDEMNVKPAKFMKIMDRFLDAEFRDYFVIMGEARRKAWLYSI